MLYLFKPIVLSRTACLGNFALERIDLSAYHVINHQKNRVDYMLALAQDPARAAQPDMIMRFTPDKDKHLLFCYEQAQSDIFKYKNVKFLIMDSFSELTDQLFMSVHNADSFCTHYVCIEHCAQFESLYKCEGLLDVQELEAYYLKFFAKVREVYADIPVIFINFPTILDEREKFKMRAEKIECAVTNAAAVLNTGSNGGNIHIINLPSRIVHPHETDKSPYHFNSETYQALASDIVAILNQYGFRIKLKLLPVK